MIESGKPNKALETAQTLAFDDIEAAALGSGTGEQASGKENANGSYERFMMTLGARGGARPGQ